jgi:hypothetical protein
MTRIRAPPWHTAKIEASGLSPLAEFDPLVRDWFAQRFAQITEPQILGWPEIRAGHDVLISAPTGSARRWQSSCWASTAWCAPPGSARCPTDRSGLRLAAQGPQQRHPHQPPKPQRIGPAKAFKSLPPAFSSARTSAWTRKPEIATMAGRCV